MSITGIRNRFLKNIAATLAAILVINPVVSLGADLALLDNATHIEAAGDLSLISAGAIHFEGVKDLHQESHEKSKSSWAWQSAKGKGNTDETLLQSQLLAQGQLAIQAAEGLNIDIREVNQQSISQTIDAMVQADPNLGWLKEMEQRGDVDWRQVQELHDSFSYSSSGLGGPAAMAVAIVVAYYTAGAASSAIGGLASSSSSALAAGTAATATTAATAAGWANVALTAAAASAAGGAAVSTINNQGDLGSVLSEVTSSDALKGYLVSAITAGATSGVLDKAFGADSDSIYRVTNGFDLGTPSGLVDFGAYLGAQGTLQAVTQTAIMGGSLSDNLQTALTGQVQHLLQAAAFNAVGDFSKASAHFADGSPEKIALHAVVGGLLSEATGGDFKTGALAAGANEALIEQLSGTIKGDQSLELAVSQLIGIAAATVTGGDYAKAAELAKNATAYNFLNHSDMSDFVEELKQCGGSAQCEIEAWEDLGYNDLSLENLEQALNVGGIIYARDLMGNISGGLDALLSVSCATSTCEAYKAELVERSLIAYANASEVAGDFEPALSMIMIGAGSVGRMPNRAPGSTPAVGSANVQKAVDYLAGVKVTKGTATGAESAANGLRLNKSLASQAQMGEAGTTMAGAGARVPFRDAQRVAREHGGNAADWVKKSSSSHTARDGTTFETHWVENIRTGQRVEFKTKFPGGD